MAFPPFRINARYEAAKMAVLVHHAAVAIPNTRLTNSA
jgi:hypothetical protein